MTQAILFKRNESPTTANICRFLEENQLNFIVRQVDEKQPLSKDDVLYIVSRSEEGFEDILSKRSSEYQKMKKKFGSMTISEMASLICEHPNLLDLPILLTRHTIIDRFTTQTANLIRQQKI